MAHSVGSRSYFWGGLLLALAGCGSGLTELKKDGVLKLDALGIGTAEKAPGRTFSASINGETGQTIRCKLHYLQDTSELNVNIDDGRAVCETTPFAGGIDLCCSLRDNGVYNVTVSPSQRWVVGHFALTCFKEILCRQPPAAAPEVRQTPPPSRTEPTVATFTPLHPRPVHTTPTPAPRPPTKPGLETFSVGETRGTPVSEISLAGCSGMLSSKLQKGGHFLIRSDAGTAEGRFNYLEQCDIQVNLERGERSAIKRHTRVELWP